MAKEEEDEEINQMENIALPEELNLHIVVAIKKTIKIKSRPIFQKSGNLCKSKDFFFKEKKTFKVCL